MSDLLSIFDLVNNSLKVDDGIDSEELSKAVTELHRKLTEPKWAIEDEVLREECEALVVSWAVYKYLNSTKGKKK